MGKKKTLDLDLGLWRQSTPKGEGGEPGSPAEDGCDPVVRGKRGGEDHGFRLCQVATV